MRRECLTLALCLLLAGCSASDVAPQIGDFAKATQEATSKGAVKDSGLSITKAELAAARRRAMVAHGAYYGRLMIGDCSLASLSEDLTYRPLEETCPLQPVLRSAEGEEVPVTTVFHSPAERLAVATVLAAAPGDEDLQRRYEASLLLAELSEYADALNTLATSNAPKEVADQVAASVTSLSKLHEGVSALKKAEGGEALELPPYKEIGGLLQNLTAEALETRRYFLLRALVSSYDETVQVAAIQLGALSALHERAEIIAKKSGAATFVPADEAAVEASEDFDAGTLAGLAAVEEAHATLIAADDGAPYAVYSGIGTTHAAILAALEAPASAEQLLAANARIQTLVKSVEAYKAAR